MGWAQLRDKVTDRLRTGIHFDEYFPLRILRTDYDLNLQGDPASPTVDSKRKVAPVDQIGEWLHMFMMYAAIRSEKCPEEGSQLMTYMDHILIMHAQKGPRVWMEYDYRFRVRRERTGVPWNVFNNPLYASVKAKCKVRAANTSVSSQPFRDYGSRSTRPVPLASVVPSTREHVPCGNAALYTDVPFARRCNEPVCTNDEWSCYTNTSKV